MRNLLFFIAIILMSSCSRYQVHCVEFLERSCKGDPWAETYVEGDSKEEKIEKMQEFLENADIKVRDIRFEELQGAVCKACVICPGKYRISLRLTEHHLDQFMELNPLDFTFIECN